MGNRIEYVKQDCSHFFVVLSCACKDESNQNGKCLAQQLIMELLAIMLKILTKPKQGIGAHKPFVIYTSSTAQGGGGSFTVGNL